MNCHPSLQSFVVLGISRLQKALCTKVGERCGLWCAENCTRSDCEAGEGQSFCCRMENTGSGWWWSRWFVFRTCHLSNATPEHVPRLYLGQVCQWGDQKSRWSWQQCIGHSIAKMNDIGIETYSHWRPLARWWHRRLAYSPNGTFIELPAPKSGLPPFLSTIQMLWMLSKNTEWAYWRNWWWKGRTYVLETLIPTMMARVERGIEDIEEERRRRRRITLGCRRAFSRDNKDIPSELWFVQGFDCYGGTMDAACNPRFPIQKLEQALFCWRLREARNACVLTCLHKTIPCSWSAGLLLDSANSDSV